MERQGLLGVPQTNYGGDGKDGGTELKEIEHVANPTAVKMTIVRVEHICCHLEVVIIEDLFNGDPDVITLNVSVTEREAYFKHKAQLTPQMIVDKLNSKSLGASLAAAGDAGKEKEAWTRHAIMDALNKAAILVLFVLGCIFMFVLGECGSHGHCDNGYLGIHYMKDSLVGLSASALNGYEIAGNLIWFAVVVLNYDMYLHAWYAVKRFSPNVETLMSIAIGGSLIQGDFLAAALVVIVVMLMDILKQQVFLYVDRLLKSMVVEAPATVNLIPQKGRPAEVIEIKELKLGMKFRIREGEQIPADGVVLAGSKVTVDESQITGEAQPVHKSRGDSVYSGAVLHSGFLDIEVTAPPDESFQGSIAAAVNRAKDSGSATQEAVAKLAKWYTPIVILIAILVAVIEQDAEKFLVILVAGCPCSLLGATPLVHGTTIALLAGNHKLLVKSAEAVEGLAQIEELGMDKTGTMTHGQFALVDLCGFDEDGNYLHDYGSDEPGRERQGDKAFLKQLLKYAACVESGDNHPIARSIVQSYDGCVVAAAALMSMDVEMQDDSFYRQGRFGVYGQVKSKPGQGSDDIKVGIGNDTFLAEMQPSPIQLPEKIRKKYELWKMRGLVLFITLDQRVGGMLLLEDGLRGDAPGTVELLGELGIKTTMLTGDKGAPAIRTALGVGIRPEVVHQFGNNFDRTQWALTQPETQELLSSQSITENGLSRVFAGLLPEQKSEWVLKASWGCDFYKLDGKKPANAELDELLAKEGMLGDVENAKFNSTEAPSGSVPVGFIGDGMNDCVALAKATVGITIQEIGNAAVVGAADVVLQGDIGNLAAGIVVARRAYRLVWANIAFAVALNLAVMVAAAVLPMPLWVSVMLDNGTLLIVLMNSLWPLCWKVPVPEDSLAGGKTESGGKMAYFEQRAKLEEAQRVGKAAHMPQTQDMSPGVQKLIQALSAKPNFDIFEDEVATEAGNPFTSTTTGSLAKEPVVVEEEEEEEEEECATG